MKKVLVTFFIIGIALLIIGGIILTTQHEDIELTNNKDFDFHLNFNLDKTINGLIDKCFDNSVLNESDFEFETIKKEYGKVDDISVESSIYSTFIQKDSSLSKVSVEVIRPIVENNDEHLFEVELNNSLDKLIIKQTYDYKDKVFNKYQKLFSKCKIIIKVPDNFEIGNIDINCSVGSININEINTKNVEIKGGVSSINLNDIEATSIELETGVGSLNAKNILSKKFEFACGVGSMDFKGNIEDLLNIDLGTGSAKIYLPENEKSYNYELDSGIGSVEINGLKYKGGARINSKVSKDIVAETGTGSISIFTK
jgi:putative adhesin